MTDDAGLLESWSLPRGLVKAKATGAEAGELEDDKRSARRRNLEEGAARADGPLLWPALPVETDGAHP